MEAGSAGEQPASNKVDVYTIKEGSHNIDYLFSFIGIPYDLKNLFIVRQIHIPFDEVYSMLNC